MSSRVCTWPISLRRPGRLWGERGLLTCYEPRNWPEGSRKTRASYTNYHIFNAKCSVNVVVLEKFPDPGDMELDGTGRKMRKIGWMELTPQMSLLVLMICSTIGFVLFQGLCLAAVPWLHCKLERLGLMSRSRSIQKIPEVSRIDYLGSTGSTEVQQTIS